MSRTSEITLDGPWTHRTIAARGARFHIAEAGDGPLVLLLHGFPQFWWTWRHQLPALADAGYRAVAMDLRGFGGSDHTPRGYDLPSLAGDVAAVIASLGARDAIVVGHDWGGLVGWTLASYEPKAVRRFAAVSAPHPLRLRASLLRRPDLTRQLWAMQAPWVPERTWSGASSSRVDAMLHAVGRPWVARPPDVADLPPRLRAGQHRLLRGGVPPLVRPLDGPTRRGALPSPAPDSVSAPVLQVHGPRRLLPAEFAQGSSRYVAAPYRWRLLDGVGHFPHEEDPEQFNGELLHWLGRPRA